MGKKADVSLPTRDRRKRVSKKNKISWRKYCNTKDVDSFLDDLRHEERIGVSFDTAEDHVLFFEDKTASDPGENKVKVITKAERKLQAKRKLEGLPKCFEALQSHSSVPDPLKKRNNVRSKEERKHPIKKKNETIRKVTGVLTAKERGAARNRAVHEEKKLNAPKPGEYTKDLWNEVPEALPCDAQWINITTYRHILKNTRKIQKKVPHSIRTKPSGLPAIEAPHPGMSYNPSYADHHSLLEEIVENEKKLIKEEQHIIRVTEKMFSKVSPKALHGTWLKEMSQGLPQSDEITIKEEDDGINEYRTVNPPVKNKLKTRKQRKSIMRVKREEFERKLKAIEKKKVADIYKLKKIEQNMEKGEIKSLEKQDLREKKKENKKFEAKRLARLKFENVEPDFSMPYEISGNLRGLISQGNILYDRFKRMEKRNILEPTVKTGKHNKSKKKVFIKRSHREEEPKQNKFQ